MRKRRVTITLLTIAIGILLLLWLKDRHHAPSTSNVEGNVASTSSSSPLATAGSPTSQQSDQQVALKEKRREILNAWEKAREKEVEFWGKVVDQHNEPIVGVVVTATVTTHQIPPASFKAQPTRIYSAMTHGDGLFYFKGRQGRGFMIETMTKSRYVLPPELQSRTSNLFWYNYDQLDPKAFKPDSSSPMIFRMWKLEQPEKLVQGDGFFGISPDNSVYTIDLLAKRKLPGAMDGDLRVRINRPSAVAVGSRNYDWSCVVEAVDGGLVESNDDFMYLAPSAGYQPACGIAVRTGDPQWTDTVKRRFYLKSRGGSVFARLDVEILANYQDKAVFSVKYYANPNGSRNLEFDPQQSAVPR